MSTSPTAAADERLTRALRITASQAVGLIGGGASLVYTHAEGDATSGRLRAAAGFASADEARATAAALESFVHATPRRANDALVSALSGRVPVHAVGDCVAPRNLLIAVHEGHAIGNRL